MLGRGGRDVNCRFAQLLVQNVPRENPFSTRNAGCRQTRHPVGLRSKLELGSASGGYVEEQKAGTLVVRPGETLGDERSWGSECRDSL